MEADDLAAFKTATEKFRKRPVLIHAADVAFFKEFLSTFQGLRLPLDTRNMAPIDLSDGEDGAGGEQAAAPATATAGATNGSAAAADGGARPAEAAPAGGNAAQAPAAAPVDAGAVADSDEEDAERLQEESEPPPALPMEIDLEPDPTPEQLAASSEARSQTEKAMEAGDLDTAITKYTEVIMAGGATALLYTKRAELLLRQKRPAAAIRDCAVALEVNPECGKAYRLRGIASRRLGRWEAAQKDLSQGQKLDFDESIPEVEKFVAEKLRRQAESRVAEAAVAASRKRQRRA